MVITLCMIHYRHRFSEKTVHATEQCNSVLESTFAACYCNRKEISVLCVVLESLTSFQGIAQ